MKDEKTNEDESDFIYGKFKKLFAFFKKISYNYL